MGEVGDGWRVAMMTLTAERTSIGEGGQTGWREVADLARRFDRDREPLVRQALARLASREMIQRWLVYRVRTAAAKGVRTSTTSRHGFAMISEYLTFKPPSHVGMRMVTGPPFFESFSGGWPFSELRVPDMKTFLFGSKLPKTYGALVDVMAKTLLFRKLAPAHRAAVLAFVEKADTDTVNANDSFLQDWRFPYLVALILDTPYHGIR